MILRFKSPKNGYMNIDTCAEEHSEGMVAGENYIEISDVDYCEISEKLDQDRYCYRDTLVCDGIL